MTVIDINNVHKEFKLYGRQLDRIREALSLFSNRTYHQSFHALTDISFSIEQGDTVGIIGRNGSGKSTLLQIICSILQPTSGSVKVNGRISALLELGAGFNPEFTGRENVFLNGSILGIEKAEMEKCFAGIERFADIGEFINQPVKNYSSGMYVRLAFAVAINVNPDILIVDEALSVGDTLFQAKCFAKFKEFQEKGVTILFVTHSMDLVTRYCNHALLLEEGRLAAIDTAKNVVDEYHRRLAKFSKSIMPDTEKEEELGINNDPTVEDASDSSISDGRTAKDGSTLVNKVSNHLKKSELAYRLNPNENRYGNGKAEIVEIGIDSLSEKEKYSFKHGESYRFWFKTKFHETIDDPITAFTIKDTKGFDLTGANTLFKNRQIGKVEKGEIILTEFDQRMMLNPGGYLLSFGCAGFEDGEYVVYDRRYDVISFEVVSAQSSVGIFDLDSKIKVRRVEDD